MTSGLLLILGKVVVLIGAGLEVRHLIGAIRKQFSGCSDLRSVATRAMTLDDVTIAGIILCLTLVVALAFTLANELMHAPIGS